MSKEILLEEALLFSESSGVEIHKVGSFVLYEWPIR